MSKADYLAKYLSAPAETSDYLTVKKSKNHKKKKAKVKEFSVNIIDNNIDVAQTTTIEADCQLADVGIDAPTIVKNEDLLEKKLENEKSKWKNFTSEKKKRHDSSSSQDSDDSDINVSKIKPNPTTTTRHDSSSENDDSDDSDVDVRRMADGGKVGLNTRDDFKKRKEKAFIKIEKGNEKTVFRDATGRRQNLLEQRKKEEEKLLKQKEREKEWSNWGAGIKTVEAKQNKKAEDDYEASKSLARYADDKDMNDYLKAIPNVNDPMARYFEKRQTKEREKKGLIPTYKGSYEPNRFGIKPGYRWDGVHRSNGFERKYFQRCASKKALKEYEYRYLNEDL